MGAPSLPWLTDNCEERSRWRAEGDSVWKVVRRSVSENPESCNVTVLCLEQDLEV